MQKQEAIVFHKLCSPCSATFRAVHFAFLRMKVASTNWLVALAAQEAAHVIGGSQGINYLLIGRKDSNQPMRGLLYLFECLMSPRQQH